MQESTSSKPVRFSSLVAKCGRPTVYLPFGDPAKDRGFMQQVKQERVLSIKQEPTSKQQDFGVVGFLPEKFVTYLIFPKSLSAFANTRIVGIKYGVIEEAAVEAGTGTPKATRRLSPRAVRPTRTAKPPKPKPQPQPFIVHLRVTAVRDQDVEVRAMNQRQAETLAKKETSGLDSSPSKIKVDVLSVRRDGKKAKAT